jgi:hypothetical protein
MKPTVTATSDIFASELSFVGGFGICMVTLRCTGSFSAPMFLNTPALFVPATLFARAPGNKRAKAAGPQHTDPGIHQEVVAFGGTDQATDRGLHQAAGSDRQTVASRPAVVCAKRSAPARVRRYCSKLRTAVTP